VSIKKFLKIIFLEQKCLYIYAMIAEIEITDIVDDNIHYRRKAKVTGLDKIHTVTCYSEVIDKIPSCNLANETQVSIDFDPVKRSHDALFVVGGKIKINCVPKLVANNAANGVLLIVTSIIE